MGYEIIQVDENTWRIEDGGQVRFFLLTGTKEALLIDSGMTIKNAKELAESLKKLARFRDRFDTIYPSHGFFPVRPELSDALYDAAVDMRNGIYEPPMVENHGTKMNCYDVGTAKFLWDGNKEKEKGNSARYDQL